MTKLYQDFYLPFTLDQSHLRGRFVRLGACLTPIMASQNYPEIVKRFLCEMATMTVLMSSSTKTSARFTLQTASIGSIPVLAVDMDCQNRIRAYAKYDAQRLENDLKSLSAKDLSQNPVQALLGSGHMGLTVELDQKNHRYQGLVDLKGKNLSQCLESYFDQSEQIPTHVKIQVQESEHHENWWAAGLMLQNLPVGHHDIPLEDGHDVDEEDWNRSCILLNSVTQQEMLDISLSPETLIYRLFHEEGPRAYPCTSVEFGCSCSQEKSIQMIKNFASDEFKNQKNISITCEFCQKVYTVDVDHLKSTP